jgi:hypothetical protein
MKEGVSMYTTAALVGLCAFVLGQAPAPEEPAAKGQKKAAQSAPPREELPRGLDAMVAEALRSNPDVLLAEAKVVEAQTALNQTRLRVTEEVIATTHERERIERMLSIAANTLDGMRRRFETGTAGNEETNQAEIPVIEAKAKLQQNVARLRYLLGLGGEKTLRDPGSAPGDTRPAARKRPELSPKHREMLEKTVRIEGPTIKVKEIVEKTTGEMVIAPSPLDQLEVLAPRGREVEVPLRVLLEMLSDAQNRGLVFLFRDYGILITNEEVARKTKAPAIPEETPLDLD